MPLVALDHVTVCTRDVARAVAFYRDVVGLEHGPRPNFDFDGAWLYCAGAPAVHIVDRARSMRRPRSTISPFARPTSPTTCGC